MPGERLARIVENGREPLSDVSPATLPLPAVVWTKSSAASPVLNLVSDVSVTSAAYLGGIGPVQSARNHRQPPAD